MFAAEINWNLSPFMALATTLLALSGVAAVLIQNHLQHKNAAVTRKDLHQETMAKLDDYIAEDSSWKQTHAERHSLLDEKVDAIRSTVQENHDLASAQLEEAEARWQGDKPDLPTKDNP